MNATTTPPSVSNPAPTPTPPVSPNNVLPLQPAAQRARVPGLWLCIAGALLFWLLSLGNWVEQDNRNAQFTEASGTKGSSYFLLGSLGVFLVFVGFAAWLAITHKVMRVGAKGVPTIPAWMALGVAGYGIYGIARALLEWISLAQTDFTVTYSNSSMTSMTILWVVAVLCTAMLALGAIRYWRGNPIASR